MKSRRIKNGITALFPKMNPNPNPNPNLNPNMNLNLNPYYFYYSRSIRCNSKLRFYSNYSILSNNLERREKTKNEWEVIKIQKRGYRHERSTMQRYAFKTLIFYPAYAVVGIIVGNYNP